MVSLALVGRHNRITEDSGLTSYESRESTTVGGPITVEYFIFTIFTRHLKGAEVES